MNLTADLRLRAGQRAREGMRRRGDDDDGEILARAAGKDVVEPGEIVACFPDRVVQIDLAFVIDGMWYPPTRLYDADRVTVVFDHAVPAPSIDDANGHIVGREFARKFGLKGFFDVGDHGICHQVIAEQGLARPGELLICPDSHTCAAGAFNCAARGCGPIDTLQAIVRGTTWFLLGETIRYEFDGSLPELVTGKDLFFHIAQEYGGHSAKNVEFGGPGLGGLPLSERRVVTTMCAEISAEFAIFEHDHVLDEYLAGRTTADYTPVAPDVDASYEDVRSIDLGSLEPYLIFPDFVPNNGAPLSGLTESIKIDQAFIGSCANGKLEDLQLAAQVLQGHKVASGVRLIVTPASQAVYAQAVKDGTVEILVDAGAVVTNATCGACCGYHMGVVGAGEICITSSTRNFKGRMGSPDAKVYMGSPATVAASAIAGEIVDPRHAS